ncbi:MAG: S1/P1 nuclease [Acidobacteria bacterium]|nr:S1/P1 nuclease [Acidobacteriota bacterium]MBI3422028.1 S1/P1 nuclease [Acidobacteriota bacterium]
MKKFLTVLLAVSLCAVTGYPYGPRGHQLVGAIADKRLAKNKAVADKLKLILDGLTLEQAATLPDAIKSWDSCSNSHPSTTPVTAKKRINSELRAFVRMNPCSGHPSHHESHYTDVPVLGSEKYADGPVGRSQFDIVQMIPFCLRVLKGDEPEKNDRAITKAVAVILLAHYLGDIHQPLHVGAEYFDASGATLEPTAANHGFADQGGNKLTLFTLMKGKETSAGKFHSYWDGQTVENAFGTTSTNARIAQRLVAKEPANWQLTGGAETWAEQVANETLLAAREAHERLEFKNIVATAGHEDITSGRAEEKIVPGGTFYALWAAAIVKDEIHKAGWRLAALLEEALQ